MKKNLLLATTIATLALFTGCTTKLSTAAVPVNDGNTLITSAPNYSPLNMNPAGRLNDTIAYTLQVAASKTIASGKKYFAIVAPDAISNTKGIMINSAKEYADKCANNNFAKALVVLTNPCNIAKGPLNGPTGGSMVIKMYGDNDKPSDILTYNAKDVLDDLKKLNMFDEGEK